MQKKENLTKHKNLLICSLFLFFFSIYSFGYCFYAKAKQKEILSNNKTIAYQYLYYIKDLIHKTFNNVINDFIIYKNSNEIESWIQNDNKENYSALSHEMKELMIVKQTYTDLTLTDASGNEKIKIHTTNGIPKNVVVNKLRNIANERYFNLTKNTSLFISPFVLQTIQNKICNPQTPIITFAAPLFDFQKKFKGELSFNYLGTNFFSLLHKTQLQMPGNLELYNKNSYLLFSSATPNKTWSFMYSERSNEKMILDNHTMWTLITKKTLNQFIYNNILVTSLILHPFRNAYNPTSNRSWILYYTIPLSELGISQRNFLIKYLLTLPVFLLVAILSSFLIGNSISYKEKLKKIAFFDPLTNLSTRPILFHNGKKALLNSNRYKTNFSILFIDLDRFKLVNDRYGHKIGDELLKIIGKELQENIRETDTICRFGGDEFVILLEHITDSYNSELIAKKILQLLQKQITVSNKKIFIGASIGIANYNKDTDSSIESTITRADKAMYQAKQNGKNQYFISHE